MGQVRVKVRVRVGVGSGYGVPTPHSLGWEHFIVYSRQICKWGKFANCGVHDITLMRLSECARVFHKGGAAFGSSKKESTEECR